MTILLLTLAGGLGAVARVVTDALVARHNPFHLPLGTVIINVTGSFLLGLLTGLFAFSSTGPSDSGGEMAKAVLGTGFCGGYTTFSTASVDAVRLWMSAEKRSGFLYVAMTLAGSLVAAALGLGLGALVA